MDVGTERRNVLISVGVLAGLGVILALIKTCKWFSRNERVVIDLSTIGKFIFYIIGVIGTILLIIVAGVSVWWLFSYKRDYENNFATDTSGLQDLLKIFLIISFVLKTLDIIHLIIRQTGIDIFFMDWERSKSGNSDSVSVWRTYFAANEFNEIQTYRRINVTFQLFFVLFFLKVINLENISCAQTKINLFTTEVNCTEYNQVFRTGIGVLTLLGTALLQFFVHMLFYQRFIENKILNFIDLCSVSNISVFILDENHHGYYIHGRSPHGITDVNMKEILMNFHREKNQMSGTRGLQNNSNEQVFIMKINRDFRKQYDLLFRNYYGYLGPHKTRKDAERYTDILLQSYQNLNGFLCAFITHSLPSHSYFIRNRYFLEKMFNYEFQIQTSTNLQGYRDNLLFIG